MRRAWMALALGLGVAPVAFAQTAALPKWLAGCWEMRAGNRVVIERWLNSGPGFQLGTSRTTVDGVARESEDMMLRVEGDKLVYRARPSGQKEAVFTSTAVSDSGFTVANPQHDFPQKIIYQRRGADSLIARIEGPGPSGTKGIDYPMQRVACAN